MDPALSYTVNGWEPMWLVYTPLITYRHADGTEGAQLIPGLATDCRRSPPTARPMS